MATPNIALVRMTVPSNDPLVDPMSVELVYQNDGGDVPSLIANAPGLFNATGAGATLPISAYISPVMDRGTNHCIIDVYDITTHLDGSPHGSPVSSGTFTLGPPNGAGGAPEGLAICVNYRSDYGTDVEFAGPRGEGLGGTRPRARDRNRHYFGPLVSNVWEGGTATGRCVIQPTVVNDFLHDCHQMLVIVSGIGPANQWNQQVWSRKAALQKPVTEFWTDDRLDYQRRRSDAPGLKTYLPA